MQTICIVEGSTVKRLTLGVVTGVSLIAVAACHDSVTSPESNNSDLSLRYGLSNPPPPPIDTGATGSFVATQDLRAPSTPKFLQPHYSIVQTSSPTEVQRIVLSAPRTKRFDFFQTTSFFSVPITYLWNPTKKSGYVHFSNDPDGVSASSNGMIKNNNGKLSGKGKLQIETDEGLLVIDLSSLQVPPSSLGCPVPDTFDAPTNTGPVCFSFFFASATLYPPVGDPIEGTVQMDPGCTPESCVIIE